MPERRLIPWLLLVVSVVAFVIVSVLTFTRPPRTVTVTRTLHDRAAIRPTDTSDEVASQFRRLVLVDESDNGYGARCALFSNVAPNKPVAWAVRLCWPVGSGG